METTTTDLHIFESGDGGELALLSGDLVLSESLYQTIYLNLFGGNVEASTRGNEIEGEERFDYWANSLIYSNKPQKQFNSLTESKLQNLPINSSGRLSLERAIKQDLDFLNNVVELSVNVVILDTNKIQASIGLSSIDNQSNKEFQFIWDNAKNEIIIDKTI